MHLLNTYTIVAEFNHCLTGSNVDFYLNKSFSLFVIAIANGVGDQVIKYNINTITIRAERHFFFNVDVFLNLKSTIHKLMILKYFQYDFLQSKLLRSDLQFFILGVVYNLCNEIFLALYAALHHIQ